MSQSQYYNLSDPQSFHASEMKEGRRRFIEKRAKLLDVGKCHWLKEDPSKVCVFELIAYIILIKL